MAWIILVISALFEAVWAIALDRISSIRDVVPILIFLVGSVISVGGLSLAMRSISVGTAYAVWVGIGAATTVIASWALGLEQLTPLKVAFIVGIVACVIGLKVIS